MGPKGQREGLKRRTRVTSVVTSLSVRVEFRLLAAKMESVSGRGESAGERIEKKVGKTDRVSLQASHWKETTGGTVSGCAK